MKKIVCILVVIAMLFALLLVHMADVAQAVAVGNNDITYIGREYDSVNDVTKFTYQITSGSKPSLSHWVRGLSTCFFDLSDLGSCSEACEWVSPDPRTGTTGIKFDTGYEDGEIRTVWFNLRGNVAEGIAEGDVYVSTKAGKNVNHATVTGPVGGTDWDSHKTSYTGPICNNFVNSDTEHTVYMRGTGFKAGTYNVVYWDGGGDKRVTDGSILVGADGILESQHTFQAGVDVAGTWYASVYLGATPESHDDITNLCADDTFDVAEYAILEFPTVIAAITVCMLCAVSYMVMRRNGGKG